MCRRRLFRATGSVATSDSITSKILLEIAKLFIHMKTFPEWPPERPEKELIEIHQHIKDFQITHGSLLKLPQTDDGHQVLSRLIGVSMFPTLFPRACFDRALELQTTYNELYVRVCEDPDWIFNVLQDLITGGDPLATALWNIYIGTKRGDSNRRLSLGIFRSDYMLDLASKHSADKGVAMSIKQVEFNNYSCAGVSHGQIVNEMHHHLSRMGCHEQGAASGSPSAISPSPENLPRTNTLPSIVSALASAHAAYNLEYPNPENTSRAVLMVVQPRNINICDERPIEYGLWDMSIPCFRIEFLAVENQCVLADSSHTLWYSPPFAPLKRYEITTIYMRAGYDADEYTPEGMAARTLLERSRAVKGPNILSHLSTFKKVQQVLSEPGVLSRFLSPEKAALVGSTFAPMYPLDASPAGQRARAIALNPRKAADHVLKPSLEGGGHNVYGKAIPAFLKSIDEKLWGHYVLMELIRPPDEVQGILLSPRDIYEGPVVSELGVFGTVLWRSNEPGPGGGKVEILENKDAGWVFKTKPAEVDEMSVVKGYGCFDCPLLFDA